MSRVTDRPVVIARRFNGPPGSGHGGYSAGCAGVLLDAPGGARSRCGGRRRSETPLAVRAAATAASRCSTATTSWPRRAPAELAVDGAAAGRRSTRRPPRPSASPGSTTTRSRPASAAGRERDPADALCLFTGPVGDGRFAVPWTPPAWAGGDVVEPVLAWAALDCPSSAPVHGTISAPVVLGRLTVALEGPIEVGAPHVIQSWLERSDGRKRHTAVAIFDRDGERRAAGRAVWVELARPLGA